MNRILALFLFILLSPLFIIIGFAVFIDDGFPIIFKQKRVGKNNSYFSIYKFRTMKKGTPDIPTNLISEKLVSFTKFGVFLRKYSLDELPQLINIIKGDLNIIGPRPALYNQSDLILLREKKGINNLKPANGLGSD